MSDNIPNPTDWVHTYQQTLFRPPPPSSPPLSTTVFTGLSDATMVTTTSTSSSTSPPPLPQYHGPLGRGSRPIRRRSRASRRTPTTIFNTDTRNFRAMVQQFTGNQTGPVESQGPVQFFGPRNINLVNPSAYNIQFQQQVQQQNFPPQGQIGETLIFNGLGNTSSSRSNNMEISENLVRDDDRINNPLSRQY